MSEHKATIQWSRETKDFVYETYNREHLWSFDSGQTLHASAAPEYLGKKNCIDPEEAFAASIASCHMLTFLAIAAKSRIVVESYTDTAVAFLKKSEETGQISVKRVELHPKITFAQGHDQSEPKLRSLHDKAHKHCFIANSVNCKIEIIL